MNSQEFRKNICRICLDEAVVLDWNDAIYSYFDETYRDCYYKYTQLECHDSEWFSTMLCQICANGLQNAHTLILKALESHKYFQETFLPNSQMDDSINVEDDIKYTPTEFETILVQKLDKEPKLQDHFMCENSDEEINIKQTKSKRSRRFKPNATITTTSIVGNQEKFNKKSEKNTKKEKKTEECIGIEDSSGYNSPQALKSSCGKPQRKATGKRKLRKEIVVQLLDDSTSIMDSDSKYKSDENDCSSSTNHIDLQTVNVEEEKRAPLLCAYCSRIFYTQAHLIKHEKTHDRNRERTEACPICGLKFYDKMTLKSHMPVHDENRERKYKCEFCIKAYFSRGGLNIHRRKHLGQMVKCNFCSKEYARQLDLDRHMSFHDVSPFTANIDISRKVRAKYFMECNTCGRKVNRECWGSHKAKHLNQPQLQCGLCNKTYYIRKSICRHIKKCHDVAIEEYANVIIAINQKFEPRHSSLMKKQNIPIE